MGHARLYSSCNLAVQSTASQGRGTYEKNDHRNTIIILPIYLFIA